MLSTGEALLVPDGNIRSRVGSISRRRSEPKGERVADESVVAERVRTTQPYRSEGALLYLRSFDGGEAGENDKNFHKSARAEAKDIQQSED